MKIPRKTPGEVAIEAERQRNAYFKGFRRGQESMRERQATFAEEYIGAHPLLVQRMRELSILGVPDKPTSQ